MRKTILSLALFLATPAFAFDTAYWAWQRNAPPNERDLAELSAQEVRTLYWQVGELENIGATWNWKARFRLRALRNLTVIPVLRLESRERTPFAGEAMRSLLAAARAAARDGYLQLDYDCPDRLLPDYANALQQIRAVVPHLTSTALPAWIHQAALAEIGASVEELLPMFYDFAPDPIVPGASPTPVIEPAKMQQWLTEWNRCRTPWRVGLPNFARLTIYDPDGKSRGHLREWSWDAVTFNDALSLVRPAESGVTLFRARTTTRIGNTRLPSGQLLAARWPERAALASARSAARLTSARGLVVFRLPDSTAASGWSLRQLQHLEARPQLALKWLPASNRIRLTNAGEADLEPESRGYFAEVETGEPSFREAEEGDFWRVRGEIEQDGKTSSVLIPLATRLRFAFSHLRAGESCESGLIRLAPGADFRHARFRVLNSPNLEWQPIEE